MKNLHTKINYLKNEKIILQNKCDDFNNSPLKITKG